MAKFWHKWACALASFRLTFFESKDFARIQNMQRQAKQATHKERRARRRKRLQQDEEQEEAEDFSYMTGGHKPSTGRKDFATFHNFSARRLLKTPVLSCFEVITSATVDISL